MKKTFFLLSMVSTLLWADDYVVAKADQKNIEIRSGKLSVGISGVVIHKISDKFQTIVARVAIIKVDKDVTTLKVFPYTDLEQDALPSLNLKPQVGDIVKLPWLHNRSLLIAPTLNSYNKLTESQKDITFVHPDIFAAHLSYEGHPSPLKEDFQSFCTQFDIGLVQIAVKDELVKIDCSSFVVLSREKIEAESGSQQKPFYSRVKEIDADWWGEGSSPVKDYDTYFEKLLGEKNAG